MKYMESFSSRISLRLGLLVHWCFGLLIRLGFILYISLTQLSSEGESSYFLSLKWMPDRLFCLLFLSRSCGQNDLCDSPRHSNTNWGVDTYPPCGNLETNSKAVLAVFSDQCGAVRVRNRRQHLFPHAAREDYDWRWHPSVRDHRAIFPICHLVSL